MKIEAWIESIPADLSKDDADRVAGTLSAEGPDYEAARAAVLGQLPEGHRVITLVVEGRAGQS